MENETVNNGVLDIIGIGNVDWSQFLIRLILAAILLVVGIALGKLVNVILRKVLDKSRVEKTQRPFLNLITSVIKWSIYVLFVNLALEQLQIPVLTRWLTSNLVIVPAFTGSLILILAGFSIANYIKKLILETKLEDWEPLAYIFFYFIIYAFLVFAFKAALISIDKTLVNYLIMIWTVILAVSVAYIKSKR